MRNLAICSLAIAAVIGCVTVINDPPLPQGNCEGLEPVITNEVVHKVSFQESQPVPVPEPSVETTESELPLITLDIDPDIRLPTILPPEPIPAPPVEVAQAAAAPKEPTRCPTGQSSNSKGKKSGSSSGKSLAKSKVKPAEPPRLATLAPRDVTEEPPTEPNESLGTTEEQVAPPADAPLLDGELPTLSVAQDNGQTVVIDYTGTPVVPAAPHNELGLLIATDAAGTPDDPQTELISEPVAAPPEEPVETPVEDAVQAPAPLLQQPNKSAPEPADIPERIRKLNPDVLAELGLTPQDLVEVGREASLKPIRELYDRLSEGEGTSADFEALLQKLEAVPPQTQPAPALVTPPEGVVEGQDQPNLD